MIKPRTFLNYLMIAVLILFSIIFYTQYEFGTSNEFGDYLFLITTPLLLFNVIPMEIRLLLPGNVLARRRGFNIVRIILVVMAGFALYMTLFVAGNDSWLGIDKNFLSFLMFLLLVFITRDNYILITRKQIRDNNLRQGRILIVIRKNIQKIKQDPPWVEIIGKRETIRINLNRIREADKAEFEKILAELS